MILYAVGVRRWWVVLSSLALLVVMCWSVGTSEVPVPTLASGLGSSQLAYFTPLLVVVSVMYCLERQLHACESTAVLPVRRLDQGAIVVTAVLVHAAGLTAGMDVARNTVLLLALALLVRSVANEAAAAGACLGFLIVNVLLGRVQSPDGLESHSWWAVALYSSSSVAAWLAAVLFFVAVLPLVSVRHSR
ncbi:MULTISPECIES: hypothetical protein [unclassified Streptomyces]|uniref:hypothetical protein n=1 Tax=unclassified Streptomyces TaxID=2593676 RepID=UPI003823FBA9